MQRASFASASNAPMPPRESAAADAGTLQLRSALGAYGLDARTAVAILLTSLLAGLTALLPQVINLYVAYGASLVVGAALAVVLARQPVVVVCSLWIVSVVGESAVVPAAGWTMPALALAIPLLAAIAVALRDGLRRVVRPSLLVAAMAVVYIAVAAVSIVPSTLAGVRPGYPLLLVATMTLGLFLVLAAIPTLIQTPGARRCVLIVVAVLGPVLALTDVILYLTGPISWAGGILGAWLFDQLTVVGRTTPIIFPNPTGFFARPASAATLAALSLIALLVLRPSVTRGSQRIALYLAAAADLVALVLTLNRDGWLLMAVAAGLIAVATYRHGRLDRLSLVTSLFLFALLGALTLNVVGANLRQDVASSRYGNTVADELQGSNADVGASVRGGATLSGRDHLWTASAKAIQQKPLLGWGLGQDQTAIGPLLSPAGQHLRGYTSDSMWLVTGVERGLLGLATLVAFALAALYVLGKRLWSRAISLDPLTLAMAAMFVGLLVGASFETYLLGALNFRGFYLGLAAGLATGVPMLLPVLGASSRHMAPAAGDADPATNKDAA